MARASAALKPTAEQCWILLGEHRGPVWLCRCVRRSTGKRVRVHFDGAWTLKREEKYGDVVGFLHTHPDGPASSSNRDVRTMSAWRRAFGKPLVCLIACPEGMRGYRFDYDASAGEMLATVQAFSRGVIIGVDADGRQISS